MFSNLPAYILLTKISQTAKVRSTVSKFTNLITTMVQIIGCDMRGPLIKFESSDNRGSNNQ